MENERLSLSSLTNEQVLERVKTLAAGERVATAALIASLAELDARGLYLAEGFPSLFAYCTQALHLSEGGAYNRTQVARTARKWPIIIQLVADGSVTLTAVRLLGGRLTDANHRQLLDAVTHKTKREVEEIVAALDPKPPVPSLIRKLPTAKPELRTPAAACTLLSIPDPPIRDTAADPDPTPTAGRLPPSRPPVVAPLAPDRYKVQFTVSRATHDRLRRVQDLLRHQVPDGDPAMIFDRALILLLRDLERKRVAHADKPRPAHAATPGSRHVPAAVRREVWTRDNGRCAFAGTRGRCAERGFLELHHVIPFAEGGETTVANLQLRCRAHNQYEADVHFTPSSMDQESEAVDLTSG